MALTTSTLVQQLYTDVLADIALFTADATLLTNPQFVGSMMNIEGISGNTVRIPTQTAWSSAGQVGEGNSIIQANDYSYDPGAVNVTMKKFGSGSDVTEESLEDGGIDLVRSQLLSGLSGALAQAIDEDGFATLYAGATETANVAAGAGTHNLVVSPMSVAMANKRDPKVTMFYDVDTDKHLFRASTRAGWAVVPNGAAGDVGVRSVKDESTVGSGAATLADFAKAVAQLRAANHTTMQNGFYAGFICPATELAIAQQLTSIAATSGTVGDLSAIGNGVLASSVIGQAVGISFNRTNNLTSN